MARPTAFLATLLCVAGAAAMPLYMQAGAPVSARVDDLVARMTLDEMAAQLTHWYSGAGNITTIFSAVGLGQVSMQTALIPDSGASPLRTVRARNALQASFLASSRLHIPLSIAHEGLHSGGEFGIIGPMPCGVGTTWNASLATALGTAYADEARAYGVDNTFSPVVNLWGADARFGRYQEGFSPDPTLTSHLGRAAVVGLQGGVQSANDYLPSFNTTVWATAKHFVGYGEALGGLNGGEFVHNNRSLFEVYLRPWRAMAAVGLRGAMPSHNTVLDVPAHASRYLIDAVLRSEFGFGNGSIVSDCSDVYALFHGFGVAENVSVAAAMGTLAGVDLDLVCSHVTYWGVLNASLADGLVALEDIRKNVAHVLTQKFAAGLFDAPFTDEAWVSRINTPAHQTLALEAAQQSAVLLQNTGGALPVRVAGDGTGLKVAMIGPHLTCDAKNDSAIGWFQEYGTSYGPLAPATRAYSTCYGRTNLLGTYILDQGWIDVPLLPDAWRATFPGSTITVAEGAKIGDATPRPDLIATAVAAAQGAHVAVVVLGDDPSTCGEWADRDDLDLPGGQLALLTALVNQTTTPIIVVLVNGRAMSFGPGNALLSSVAAVVETWRPGMAGAQALVDVLTGRINFSGKLANQWSQGVGSIGSGATPWLARVPGKWVANGRSTPDPTDGRQYDSYVASQYGSASGLPLFRFGHGLSYTTYAYKTLSVSVLAHPASLPHAGTFSGRGAQGYLSAISTAVLNVSVSVCNTGGVDGVEIVQVYSQDPRGYVHSPAGVAPFWKRLVGFGRLPLSAGQCDTLVLPVLGDDIAMYDDSMTLRVMPGSYTISAGGRSDQDVLQQTVVLQGGEEAEGERLSGRDRLVRSLGRVV